MFGIIVVIFGVCAVSPLVGLAVALWQTRSPFEARRRVRQTATRYLFSYYSILLACFVAAVLTPARDFPGKLPLNLVFVFVIASGVAVGANLVRRAREIGSADYSTYCPACGYDLGHAEHETCPECGGGDAAG